jgi:hypothetical protein
LDSNEVIVKLPFVGNAPGSWRLPILHADVKASRRGVLIAQEAQRQSIEQCKLVKIGCNKSAGGAGRATLHTLRISGDCIQFIDSAMPLG